MSSLSKIAVLGLLGSLLQAAAVAAQTSAPALTTPHRKASSLPAPEQTQPQVQQTTPAVSRTQPAGPQSPQPPAQVPAAQVAATAQPASARPTVPASPPRVSLQNGELTVVAENSSLAEVLSAIRAATGITIEGPTGGGDRILAKIGPAPVRDVLLSLLEGSRFDFAMLGSETNPDKVERLILSVRAPSGTPGTTATVSQQPNTNAAEAAAAGDDDDNSGFAEQPKAAPATPAGAQPVKTPEQLLEDLRKLEADRAQQQATQPTAPAEPGAPVDPNAPRPARPDRPK